MRHNSAIQRYVEGDCTMKRKSEIGNGIYICEQRYYGLQKLDEEISAMNNKVMKVALREQ